MACLKKVLRNILFTRVVFKGRESLIVPCRGIQNGEVGEVGRKMVERGQGYKTGDWVLWKMVRGKEVWIV